MNKVDAELLYNLYAIEGKPMHQVSKEMGISVGSVYNYLKKYDIATREHKQSFTYKGHTHSDKVKALISRTHKGKVISEATKKKMSEASKKGGIGHKKQRTDGYVAIYFPDHPYSNKDGYIMEHILVMECIIGRHLKADEIVHHKNHKRNDNRKENLEIMTFKEHAALHMTERHNKKKGGMTY